MMAADRDAWRCDLAETYGIFDYTALPVELLATLSVGLRENSRIKMKLNGMRMTNNELLLMMSVDYLKMLVWMNTEDGAKNINRPKSMVAEVLGSASTSDLQAFDTGEDFEAARKNILGEV